MGAVLGKAIGEPYGLDPLVVSITVLVVCYGFEVDSIYGHIYYSHIRIYIICYTLFSSLYVQD